MKRILVAALLLALVFALPSAQLNIVSKDLVIAHLERPNARALALKPKLPVMIAFGGFVSL